MRIGIIKEGKVPADSRVALTPDQIKFITSQYNVEVVVAPSSSRCIENEEYEKEGIQMQEDLSDCDLLLGIKEVPVDLLVRDKKYMFFSHTIKKQAHNRKLLQAILKQNIDLIDYEVLTNSRGQRLIAFGKFAGMVGAHNALWTYGKRSKNFSLPRMKDCFDYAEAKSHYAQTKFPNVKIVLTGTGRVASGAAQVLDDMQILRVNPEDFLNKKFSRAVYTQLSSKEYIRRKDGNEFVKAEFYKKPEDHFGDFEAYTAEADIMINGIYWDNKAPVFFTLDQMKKDVFNLKVIADVTCDIAPIASIPSTLFASTISDPVFGFDAKSESICAPFSENCIDMMTIDNLPNEMPRDASLAFGKMFIDNILEEFLKKDSEIILKATVAKQGDLGPYFKYLDDYINEKVTV